MIFGQCDISIELARPRKRVTFGPCVFFRCIGITSRFDKCAKKPDVLIVYQSVLIHVDLKCHRIGNRERILEKGIEYLQVVGSPSMITVQIAEHE